MSTIGLKINTLADLRVEKEGLSQQIKELNEKIKEVEGEIIDNMQENDIDKLSSERATVSLKIDVFSRVIDKPKFYEYIVKNKAWELAQARVNNAPIKLLLEENNTLPEGIETYTQPKLSFRRK